ncbi:3-hydroxyacyl-[acyl-carrier-protein] dehydratase FERN, mitochondrial isoform X1 [Aristolochia californica]|uniref:3-hydroxyacyl-[acyl-carrier-protein] dehydratase FERN, mitochondrial isoform X1 n=1 Tax=Aristolochia californica TaxID=171875 RepID=UPI0035D7DBD2
MVFCSRIVKPFVTSFSSASNPLLKVGSTFRKPKTFNHPDLVNYAEVTGDYNPLHFDSDFAKGKGFEDRLVHGMLVASLFPCILASHFVRLGSVLFRHDLLALQNSVVTEPGAVYVSQRLQFKLPVYIGDEVVAEVKALNLRESKKRYLAKFSTKCFRDGSLLVIDGEALVMLPTLEIREGPVRSC